MAVEPLFVVDYGTGLPSIDRLYERMRLSPDAITVTTRRTLERMVQSVRVKLYSALGADSVNQIKAYTPEENPTTEDALQRLRAETSEVLWCTYLAFTEFPVAVYDSLLSDPPSQIWDKEPLTRDIDPELWEQHREVLWEELQDMLGQIDPDAGGSLQADSIGPSEDVIEHPPGSSIIYEGSLLDYGGQVSEL